MPEGQRVQTVSDVCVGGTDTPYPLWHFDWSWQTLQWKMVWEGMEAVIKGYYLGQVRDMAILYMVEMTIYLSIYTYTFIHSVIVYIYIYIERERES